MNIFLSAKLFDIAQYKQGDLSMADNYQIYDLNMTGDTVKASLNKVNNNDLLKRDSGEAVKLVLATEADSTNAVLKRSTIESKIQNWTKINVANRLITINDNAIKYYDLNNLDEQSHWGLFFTKAHKDVQIIDPEGTTDNIGYVLRFNIDAIASNAHPYWGVESVLSKTISGDGNAVTNISVEDHAITLIRNTKFATYAEYLGLQSVVDTKLSNSLLTQTGDIIYASGVNTPASLHITADDHNKVLRAVGNTPVWTAETNITVQEVKPTSQRITAITGLTANDHTLSANYTEVVGFNDIGDKLSVTYDPDTKMLTITKA